MNNQSILFNNYEWHGDHQTEMPAFFTDLNLDQLVDQISSSKTDYDLKSYFYEMLNDLDSINYRQEVFKDLEDADLLNTINSFSRKMLDMRHHLQMINGLYYLYHKQGWFLEAVTEYIEAVETFASKLSTPTIQSRGLLAFREYFSHYVKLPDFNVMKNDLKEIKFRLSSIRYNVIIKSNIVRVRKYDDEIDYSKEIEDFFAKFAQGEVANYLVDLNLRGGMNHVEAQIIDCVAALFPEIFNSLNQFYEKYIDFWDENVLRFDREIQFFIAYLEYISDIRDARFKFCFPNLSSRKKNIAIQNAFDIVLAKKMIFEESQVVPNDVLLQNNERIIIVSGPNQGGKTTFARMLGQINVLSRLGCPIPGESANLFLFDQIFTHFDREEQIINLRGKLKDDLVRIREILEKATSKSLIIVNEIFSSTALKDATFLSECILKKIMNLDAFCVFVSFIHELSELSENTISMVSTVNPENPVERTYKIVRKPADGLAYAHLIAEKHHLTYESIIKRI